MNRKMIAHILAKMLGVEALLLILPALVGVIYQEKSTVYFLPPDSSAGTDLCDWGKKKSRRILPYMRKKEW